MEYFFVCVYTKLEGIAKQDGTHWAAYQGVDENHFWVEEQHALSMSWQSSSEVPPRWSWIILLQAGYLPS